MYSIGSPGCVPDHVSAAARSRKHELQAGGVANGWTQAGDALEAVGTVHATRMTSGAKHLVDEELLCEWLHHRCNFGTRISLQAVADLLRGRHAAMTSEASSTVSFSPALPLA